MIHSIHYSELINDKSQTAHLYSTITCIRWAQYENLWLCRANYQMTYLLNFPEINFAHMDIKLTHMTHSMHIQGVDAEVEGREVHALKHLHEGLSTAVLDVHNFLGVLLHGALDEA